MLEHSGGATHEDILTQIKRHEARTAEQNDALWIKISKNEDRLERYLLALLGVVGAVAIPVSLFLFSLSGKVEANGAVAISADTSVTRIEARLDEFQRFLREDNKELRMEIRELRAATKTKED